MPRPRSKKRIKDNPEITFYKPQGIPLRELKTTELSYEEWEALRLKHKRGLAQKEAAKEMDTSQSTFQRILSSAQKKLGESIIEGKAIKIVKKTDPNV